MTRFARAEGSKSSNRKIPDESTPWHILKQQLEEALTKEKVQGSETNQKKSAKQLLKEDDRYYAESLGNINTDWAEFDAPRNKSSLKNGKVEKNPTNQEKKMKKVVKQMAHVEDASTSNIEKVEKIKNKKNKAPKLSNDDIQGELKPNPQKNIEKSSDNDESPSKLKKKKRKREQSIGELPKNDQNLRVNTVNELEKTKEALKDGSKLSKRQKRNQKKQNQKNEETKENGNAKSGSFNVEGNDWDCSVKSNDKVKSKKRTNNKSSVTKREWISDFDFKNWRRFGNNVPKKYQKKEAKPKDNREHKHKKTDESPVKITINGMDVEIVKYDGFPVKREDAERLKELRQQMVLKGIPKPDIDTAMKLERRKCEKSLARIRKQVCFHCRKAGHNLSDCPELGKEEEATGICFKCGSTEHTHFECKVTKSDDYRFAKCFICREQGHIAKQCPDNPKGLYPDGGCCNVCGDVTHLKKDCPDLNEKKEDNSIKLDLIKDDHLESLDVDTVISKPDVKPMKKIVKF
ncbi:RNA-binding protein 25 [Copidosoma floridanum]|uniref:RNA-binding protein 25 n=1 Tax=Copidosoma floridanum TaxID=29053 RepID=UPI0006C9823B|nr:RNA-binding protein 25 [Copidosoma floridanum]